MIPNNDPTLRVRGTMTANDGTKVTLTLPIVAFDDTNGMPLVVPVIKSDDWTISQRGGGLMAAASVAADYELVAVALENRGTDDSDPIVTAFAGPTVREIVRDTDGNIIASSEGPSVTLGVTRSGKVRVLDGTPTD